MAIPHSVLAAGWVPFAVVLVFTLVFAFLYIRYYQSKYDKELCSTLSSIAALSVALLTSAMLPVDIFLVSFMKDTNGTFKSWAENKEDRQSIIDGVLYAYYALYLLVILFVFFILPLAYFFYEEGDEEQVNTVKSRCCGALKYTLVFVLIAVVLVLVGAFVPWRAASDHGNSTDTDWEKIKNIFTDLGHGRGEDALSFCISILTMLGYLAVILYTAYGMSCWPMDLVKGRRSVSKERQEVGDSIEEMQDKITAIRQKQRNGRQLSNRDQREIDSLEDRIAVLLRRNQHLSRAERSCMRKCGFLLRPFEIFFGIVFFLMALLVFVSLLLSNIDKILHSLGPHMAYLLPDPTLPNPLDIVLGLAQKAFPTDYILMTGLLLYFVFCSMGGISHIGIWFCCIRMFKIRPSRTKPQGLLFMCFLLSFITLALNVLFYQLAPQYTMYGSQLYWKNETSTHGNTTQHTHKLVPCTAEASADDCIMTRMTMLITRFCYKMWFFGAGYYWASWAFLGIFVIGFVVAVVRKRRSYVEGSVDIDDIPDSDEELIAP